MKQPAILEYVIMFDASEAWQHGSQFEKDFGDFFAAHGFEAQVLEVKGNSGKRYLMLNRMETTTPKLENKPAKDPQQILKVNNKPIEFRQKSSTPILKGITPTKRGPQPKLKSFSDMKFHNHKGKI